jgi:hypothetical protein
MVSSLLAGILFSSSKRRDGAVADPWGNAAADLGYTVAGFISE